MNETEIDNKIYKCGRAFFAFMCAFIICCLAIAALIVTVYYPADYQEVPFISFESSIVTAIFAAVFLLVVFVAFKTHAFENIELKYLTCFMSLFTLILGVLWVVCTKSYPKPASNMEFVCQNAENMVNGNFSLLRPLEYFAMYTFQLGISTVLFIYRIVFVENYQLAFQISNVIFLCITYYFLSKITDILFKSQTVSALVRMLFMLCTAPILCCTLLYGTIISPMFCVIGLYCALQASKQSKKYYLLTIIFITIANLCKPNALIFAIGIAIYLIFDTIGTKNIFAVITALCMFVAMSLSSSFLLSCYEDVSGYSLNNTMPKTAWIAMGLQDGPLGPGWFNNYNESIYRSNNGDVNVVNSVAISSIKDSVINFARSPGYTLRFFGKKAILQWCEPTYSSFWISAPDVVHGEDRGLRVFITLLYFGDLHNAIVSYMDIMQLVFYIGAAFCFIRCFKRLSIRQLTPAIVIIGGVAYHLLSESRCLYALPYYILFVPYAAFGIITCCEDITGKYFKKGMHEKQK